MVFIYIKYNFIWFVLDHCNIAFNFLGKYYWDLFICLYLLFKKNIKKGFTGTFWLFFFY